MSLSAFGVDHGWFSKKKKDDHHVATGSATAAVGGVTAAGGLTAGGIPRAKVDSIKLEHLTKNPEVRQGPRGKRMRAALRNAPRATRGAAGGMGGFRESAHYIFESSHGAKAHEIAQGRPISELSKPEAFQHGLHEGKRIPERTIMRQMKNLRRGGHAALAGGAGLTYAGVQHARGKPLIPEKVKEKVRKDDRNRRRVEAASGTALGLGASGVATSHVGGKVFASQSRKWKERAHRSLTQAGDIAPRTGGAETKMVNVHGRDVELPKIQDKKIRNDPRILAGRSKEQAHLVGQLRGEAGQQAYFGEVHGVHAKYARRLKKPSLKLAGAGAAGLAGAEGYKAWKKREKR